MATYKVLQDIEAEDKLLGPLTLKQFIFAIVTIGIGFVEFKLITTTGLGIVRYPFVFALLVPMIIFGFLAAPISRDQPNDVWLLARLRFFIKPHNRIWNQDGLSQLVTITAPKRLDHIFTNNLSQNEVRSRLSALATTLDSRGWAIKNVNVNMFGQPGYLSTDDGSDRLVAPSALPTSVTDTDVLPADDMLDAKSNPTAQHLEQMVEASTQAHREKVMQSVKQGGTQSTQPPADYWFLNQPAQGGQQSSAPGYTTFAASRVVVPGSSSAATPAPTAEEQALIDKIEAEQARMQSAFGSHIKTIQPLSGSHPSGPAMPIGSSTPTPSPVAPAASPLPKPATKQQTPPPNPAILSLANNDDLNVATIARQAQQLSESDGEVVISLH